MIEAGAIFFIHIRFILNHYFLYMRGQNVSSICLKACQNSLFHQKFYKYFSMLFYPSFQYELYIPELVMVSLLQIFQYSLFLIVTLYCFQWQKRTP